MEASINQHVLTFSKGICNLSPDLTCPDDELQDCVGLTYHDDALRPIQDTKEKMTVDGQLLFVHELNTSKKNYIYFVKEGEEKENTLYYCYISEDGTSVTGIIDTDLGTVTQVKSIGNTLIVNSSEGLYYFLWKDNEYKALGNSIPKPVFSFSLDNKGYNWTNDKGVTDITKNIANVNGIITFDNRTGTSFYVYIDGTQTSLKGQFDGGKTTYVVFVEYNASESVDQTNAATDLFTGLYAKQKNEAHKNNSFVNPFSAICCLRLYDGTYTYISNPIHIFPNIVDPFYCSIEDNNEYCATPCYYLKFSQNTDYSEWKDIVDNVCIFVSREMDLLDTTELDIYPIYYKDGSAEKVFVPKGLCNNAFDSHFKNYFSGLSLTTKSTANQMYKKDNLTGQSSFKVHVKPDNAHLDVRPFKSRTEKQVMDDLQNNSTFFFLCDVGIKPASDVNTKDIIKTNVLLNIETQETLPNIDYYNFCNIIPDHIETYNRRLNAYGASRTIFSGFSTFWAYSPDTDSDRIYYAVTTIETSDGVRKVMQRLDSSMAIYKGMPLYYPDPRATKMDIYLADNNQYKLLMSCELEEHKGLNSSHYVSELLPGSYQDSSTTGVYSKDNLSLDDTPETLQNYLLQSQVDNPFTFNASGYVRVGQGTIIGIAALTTALNQDAYKIATTIVFTTQGIWALKINDEGQYISVAPPFSREVCVNANTITMVDNGVFFVSKKGLMLIDDNGCRCVSQQLSGKNPTNIDGTAVYGSFIDFARNCIMAYDYRDSQLWLVNNSYVLDAQGVKQYNYDYHWVYNMKTGTFSRKKDSKHYTSIVTDYPDTLCQNASDMKVYSMLEEPNINTDTTVYGCSFVTRPLKLDGSVILKSLRQLKHLIDPDITIMTDESVFGSSDNTKPSLFLKIEGTNDLRTWTTLSSLRGKPYKFFRLHYELKNLSATDTISGLILQTQKRYTEKLI